MVTSGSDEDSETVVSSTEGSVGSSTLFHAVIDNTIDADNTAAINLLFIIFPPSEQSAESNSNAFSDARCRFPVSARFERTVGCESVA